MPSSVAEAKERYLVGAQRHHLRITGTKLGAALEQLSEQAGFEFLLPYELSESVKTSTFSGYYSVNEALALMLRNTDLAGGLSNGRVTITRRQAPNGRGGEDMARLGTKGRLAAGVSALVMGATPGARAQEPAEVPTTAAAAAEPAVAGAVPPEEDIVVTGIRRSLQDARGIKRSSMGVVDAISAEELGKFPDTNVAESLQRISGVSIDRTGGEGQTITVRGFGPEFNTVLINGRQLASENLSRAFSFDTLSSELVSGLEVFKTSTAMLQSGGVGSTVNIKTARPFDSKGLKLFASANAAYEENREKVTPQGSFLISNTFAEDRFGVLLAASYAKRSTRLNQAQTDGWLENVGIPQAQLNGGAGFDGNVFSPRNFDTKVTFEERERINANLVLQYRPVESVLVTLDGLYSKFDVVTDATSFGHWFTAPNVERAITDDNGTVVDLFQDVGYATDFHSKKFDRLTETYALAGNIAWAATDNLDLSVDAHYSKATRAANNGRGDQLSLIGYSNRVRFRVDDQSLPYASDFDTADPTQFSGQQELDGVAYQPGVVPVGVSDYLDPANSRAHVMLRRGWAVDDEVKQIKFDAKWTERGDSGLKALKGGFLYSEEKKALTRFDNEGVGIHCTYCGYGDFPPILAGSQYVFDAGSNFLGGLSGSDRLFTRWLAHDGEDQFRYVESTSGLNFDAVRRDNSFEVEEKTTSGYVEAEFGGTIGGLPIAAVAGVRYERTDVTVTGTQAPIESLRILDRTELLASFASRTGISSESGYDNLLPNVSARLDITDRLVARVAASRTLTRPTLESLAPVTVIVTTRQGGNLTATSGNPALVPFLSDNLDVSLEYYFGRSNYISVGAFQKSVNNFIVSTNVDQTFVTANGTVLRDPSTGTDLLAPDAADAEAVFTVTRPENGETAKVQGVELAAQYAFGDTGFGLIANATFVTSDAKLDVADIDQVFALTGLSDSYNIVGYYEKGPYQLRIAYNHRDPFLRSLTQSNGDGVVFVEEYAQVDISGSYDVTENVSIFFEGINLAGEYVEQYGRFRNHFLLAEDSGRRWALGVRASF